MNDGHLPTVVADQVVLTLWKRIATQQTAQFFKYGAIWPAAAQLHIVRTALGAEPRGRPALGRLFRNISVLQQKFGIRAEAAHPSSQLRLATGGDVQDLAAFRQRLKPLRIRPDALAHIVRHASGRETDAEGTQLMPSLKSSRTAPGCSTPSPQHDREYTAFSYSSQNTIHPEPDKKFHIRLPIFHSTTKQLGEHHWYGGGCLAPYDKLSSLPRLRSFTVFPAFGLSGVQRGNAPCQP